MKSPESRPCFGLFLMACSWLVVGIMGCQGPASSSAGDASAASSSESDSDDGAEVLGHTEGSLGNDGTDPSGGEIATITDTGDGSSEYRIVALPDTSKSPGGYVFELVAVKPEARGELSFLWDFGDGELYEGKTQDYSFPAGGSYLVTVTAKTPRGQTAFVLTLELEVEMPEQAPVARAGDDQTVDEGSQLCLDGSASLDPNDDPLTFEWRQGAGVPVSLLETADPAVVCFQAPDVDDDEELLFLLHVSDGIHATEDTVQVTVLDLIDLTSALVADAGPNREVTEGDRVVLDGSDSHGVEGAELTFAWRQTSGPPVDLQGAAGPIASFYAPEVDEKATLAFQLTVSDGPLTAVDDVEVYVTSLLAPASAECPVFFTVAADGAPPSDPVEGTAPLEVTCTAVPVDGAELPEGTYTWLFAAEDGAVTDVEESGPVTTHGQLNHVFTSPGSYRVLLMFTFVGAAAPLGCMTDGAGLGEVSVLVAEPDAGGGGGGSPPPPPPPPAGDCVNDSDCGDSLFCNGIESCVDGACQPGDSPCTDPGLPVCDEGTDTCAECLADGDCDDGAFCTGAETCVDGSCKPGDDPCPGRMCDEDADACFDLECAGDGECDDGVFCNGAESCVDNSCVGGTPPCPGELCRESDDSCVECLDDGDCSDGAFCNGVETCDAGGDCQPGGDPCPGEMCRESDDSCVECLTAGDCNDGLFCTGTETCDAGGNCQSSGDPCTDPAQPFCDDGSDECVECLVDGDCDDGLFCTGIETCDASGACQSSGNPCPPDQTCEDTSDQCLAGHAISGTVRDFDSQSYSGVPVIFTGEGGSAGTDFVATSDAGGQYVQIVPIGWSGSVSSNEDYRFEVESRAYSGVGADVPGQDFMAFRNYYVDDDGDQQPGYDPGDPLGTINNPHATIQIAANLVDPGDTVYIKAGTYVPAAGADWIVNVTRSGTASAPIVLREFPGDSVLLDASGQKYSVRVIGADYVTISGLECANGIRGGIFLSGSNYYVVQNNEVHDVRDTGSVNFVVAGITAEQAHVGGVIRKNRVYDSGKGILVRGMSGLIEDVLIERNYVHDIHWFDGTGAYNDKNSDGIGCNDGLDITIRQNVIARCGDDGMDIYNSLYCIIDRNVCFNMGDVLSGTPEGSNGDGNGIKTTTGGGGGHILTENFCLNNKNAGFDEDHVEAAAPGNIYYNNVAYGNGKNGFGIFGQASTDNLFRNNIAVANDQLGVGYTDIRIDDNVPADSDYNLWGDADWPRDGEQIEFPVPVGHSLSGDPIFASPPTPGVLLDLADPGVIVDIASASFGYVEGFELQAGSPCIDAGTDVGSAFNGAARDMGVYESP